MGAGTLNSISDISIADLIPARGDAFGRLRVSQPSTIFDSKLLNDKQPTFWDEKQYGGAVESVHSSDEARARMSTTGSGQGIIRQTFQRFNYQPGKSTLVFMTTSGISTEANVRKRMGLFKTSDAADSVPQNGIYLENDNGTISWNIAKAGSMSQSVTQDQWNYNKLQGQGDIDGPDIGSRSFTLDPTKNIIILIDFEWLGVGLVRVGFVIDGQFVYVHQFRHANVTSGVYMSTPNLPLGYSIYQSGAGSGTFDHICSSVISEGGIEPRGAEHSANAGDDECQCNSNGTEYAVFGARLAPDYQDITIIPTNLSLLAASNDDFLWQAKILTTVTGTFNYVQAPGSALEVAIGNATNPGPTASGGIVRASGYSPGNDNIEIDTDILPRLGVGIDGVSRELVVTVTPLSNGLNLFPAGTWREVI